MFWQIQATVTIREGQSSRTHQIPTFHLSVMLLGLSGEHGAMEVVRDVLNPSNDPDVTVKASLLLVDREDMAAELERQQSARRRVA